MTDGLRPRSESAPVRHERDITCFQPPLLIPNSSGPVFLPRAGWAIVAYKTPSGPIARAEGRAALLLQTTFAAGSNRTGSGRRGCFYSKQEQWCGDPTKVSTRISDSSTPSLTLATRACVQSEELTPAPQTDLDVGLLSQTARADWHAKVQSAGRAGTRELWRTHAGRPSRPTGRKTRADRRTDLEVHVLKPASRRRAGWRAARADVEINQGDRSRNAEGLAGVA